MFTNVCITLEGVSDMLAEYATMMLQLKMCYTVCLFSPSRVQMWGLEGHGLGPWKQEYVPRAVFLWRKREDTTDLMNNLTQ